MLKTVINAVRRNHALEHATISILLNRHGPMRVVGRAVPDGFYIYGDIPTERLRELADEALARLQRGEADLGVLNLFNRMGDWEKRAPLVIDQLEALSPDVIAFQEVDLGLDQGMWIARQLNLRLTDQPHYRMKHAASPGKRVSFHGIGTLSRLEFLEHEILDLMTFERVAQRMVFPCAERSFL